MRKEMERLLKRTADFSRRVGMPQRTGALGEYGAGLNR